MSSERFGIPRSYETIHRNCIYSYLAILYVGIAKADVPNDSEEDAQPDQESSIVDRSSSEEPDETLETEVEPQQATLIVVGGAAGETPSPTLNRLTERLATVDPKSTIVIFTGNYSSAGEMPGKNHKKRSTVERHVRAHVDTVRDFVSRGGRTFFLSGHRDYAGRGRKGVRRLRKFINRELNKTVQDDDHDVDVMPSADCGEPTTVDLGEFGVLAVVNTQWWMQDWRAHARANEGCEYTSRGELATEVQLLTRKNRTKRLVVAMHHPLKSLGKFGGHFKAVEHFKPPIAGSIAVWLKQGGLIPQYRNHVKYDSLASSFYASAEKSGSVVFVSGHDRSLQLLEVGNQTQIVSGSSGLEPTYVVRARGNDFAKQASGWAEIQLNAQHKDRVSLISGESGETLITRALPEVGKVGADNLSPAPAVKKTSAKSTYAKRKPGKTRFFKRALLGRHYRDAHRLELDFPVLDLSTRAGRSRADRCRRRQPNQFVAC